MNQNLHGL